MSESPQLELTTTDLALLGRTYSSSDRGLSIEHGNGEIRIEPRLATWWSMAGMTLLTTSVFAGFIYVIARYGQPTLLGNGIWVIMALIGVIALAGPIVAQKLREKYLKANSPLLRYSEFGGLVTILGDSQQFQSLDVYGLLGLTLMSPTRTPMSELQLYVREQEKLVPHLVATSLSSSASRTFGKILKQFGTESGMLTMIAEPKWNLFRPGPVEMKIATPESRQIEEID